MLNHIDPLPSSPRSSRFPSYHPALLAVAVIALFLSVPASAAESLAQFIRAHYTKHEVEIPMRDGVRLFTAIYTPKDTQRSYPILLNRTPYSIAPYGVDHFRSLIGPSERFAREGYIVVYQDVRGRFMSEGVFVEMTPQRSADPSRRVDESTDAWDTIDWLVRNVPGNNGKVGIWGISYPGFYAAAGMIDAHPALKAASPQAPVTDLYMGDDSFHNGAFFLAANFGFYTFFNARGPEPQRPVRGPRFDYGTPDGYQFYLDLGPLSNANDRYFQGKIPYWNDLMAHTSYDAFWQSRDLSRQIKNVSPAVLTVGGWFDAEDPSGPLKVFSAVEKDGKASQNTLVMGPWSHGGWAHGDQDRLGDVDFNSKTGEFFRDQIEFPFFNAYLNDKAEQFPKAWVFETGTNRWRRFDSWPPANLQQTAFYLGPEGSLRKEAPGETGGQFDEYLSDPSRPVPYIGEIAQGMEGDYIVHDQRFAARRPDVLVFSTPPLQQDLSVAGPIDVSLWVSTSGTDSDFVVKVIDVYPGDYPDPDPNPREISRGGYQQMVRGEPFRAKFRNSFEKPEPMPPGEPVQIRFALPDICHVFRKGHRLMVHIQSSWFPLVDRNPQSFVDIPSAKASDFREAVQRVYRSGSMASSIRFLESTPK